MQPINPYASPRADLEPIYITQVIPAGHPPGVWRMGYLLVMTGDGVLPQRCVMTNQPAESSDQSMIGFMGNQIPVPVSRKYLDDTGHHKTIAFTMQVTGVVAVLAGWGVASVGLPIPMFVRAAAGITALVGLVLFFTGIYWRSAFVPALTIEHFTPQFLWLRGVHPDYLAALPEWPYGSWRWRT